MFLEWQRYVRDMGADSALAEAARHRFEMCEADTIARYKQTAAGRKLLPRVAECRTLPTSHVTPYEQRCNDAPLSEPYFTNDAGQRQRVSGITRIKHHTKVGNGPGFGLYSPGWVVRMQTRLGEFRAKLPAMEWDQLAFELDAVRFRLLQAGFFGGRELRANKRTRAAHLKPKWNYPAQGKQWLAEGVAPSPCAELSDPLERWIEETNRRVEFMLRFGR